MTAWLLPLTVAELGSIHVMTFIITVADDRLHQSHVDEQNALFAV